MKYLNRSILSFIFGIGYFGSVFLGIIGIDEKTIVDRILLFNCFISGTAAVFGIKEGIYSTNNERSFFEFIGIILNMLLLSSMIFIMIIILK